MAINDLLAVSSVNGPLLNLVFSTTKQFSLPSHQATEFKEKKALCGCIETLLGCLDGSPSQEKVPTKSQLISLFWIVIPVVPESCR